MKPSLETCPIYHKRDQSIRSHLFCSFLALLLKRALRQPLEQNGESSHWAKILHGSAAESSTETRPNVTSKPPSGITVALPLRLTHGAFCCLMRKNALLPPEYE